MRSCLFERRQWPHNWRAKNPFDANTPPRGNRAAVCFCADLKPLVSRQA